MIDRILPTALLMVIVLCAASLATETEVGFVPIFNGKDLSGWEGEAGFWSVQDGAITGINPAEKPIERLTFLMWRGGTVDNFELRFSYRIPTGNSGLQFRSCELEQWNVAGYQADFDAGRQHAGCLYDCHSNRADPDRVIGPRGQKVVIDAQGKRTASVIADPADLLRHVKTNQWNEYHVIARGTLISLKINGVLMSQVIDREEGKAQKRGIIAIQLHGGPPMKVQVKDIQLKHLN
jgi:hypothetical protein